MAWFLSQNWSGLVMALAMAILAAGVFLGARRILLPGISRGVRFVGGFLAVVSVLLFLGAGLHLFMVARDNERFPPPGRLVDVGGYKMHILAEGAGAQPVVWIPGSHDGGLALHVLHSKMAKETRSILFDRPGSGWSDVGPFPRTVELEVEELHTLLHAAGEKGPFVIAAHSLGGFLAQYYADLYPEDVAGLVLLDSAALDASIYTSRLKENKIPGAGLGMVLGATFGVTRFFLKREQKRGAQWLSIYDPDIQDQIIFSMSQPKLTVAFNEALRAVFDNPFGMVKGYHALGDIPIFAVIPPVDVEDQIKLVASQVPHWSEREVKNFVRLRIDSQHQHARLSTRGELHHSPAGTTHGFPFEAPDFTLDEVRKMIALVSGPQKSS